MNNIFEVSVKIDEAEMMRYLVSEATSQMKKQLKQSAETATNRNLAAIIDVRVRALLLSDVFQAEIQGVVDAVMADPATDVVAVMKREISKHTPKAAKGKT